MERSVRGSVASGIAGGLLAGALVAAWFFVADLMAGDALRTPLALAEVYFGSAAGEASVQAVAGYTILHFGAFTLLGAVAGGFLALLGVTPGLLVGAAFGLFVLDGVHYVSLWLTGVDPLQVLPVGHVVAANVAGGLAMMGYMHRAVGADRPLGPAVLQEYPVLADGLVTGLLGAGAVALWFLVLDLAGGRVFYTPAALGSALLLGARSAADVTVNIGVVAAYTVVHVTAFWVAGVLFELAARGMERTPSIGLIVVLAFIVVEAVFVPVVGLAGEWVMGGHSWWAAAIGNLLAVTVMGVWTRWRHPTVVEAIHGEVADASA